MLLEGFDHVAVLTADTGRLRPLCRDTVDAHVESDLRREEGVRP